MSLMQNRIKLILVVIVVMFASFVWPTLYRYDHLTLGDSRVPVRINRFTGNAQLLYVYGWVKMKKRVAAENKSFDDTSYPSQAPMSSAVAPQP